MPCPRNKGLMKWRVGGRYLVLLASFWKDKLQSKGSLDHETEILPCMPANTPLLKLNSYVDEERCNPYPGIQPDKKGHFNRDLPQVRRFESRQGISSVEKKRSSELAGQPKLRTSCGQRQPLGQPLERHRPTISYMMKSLAICDPMLTRTAQLALP